MFYITLMIAGSPFILGHYIALSWELAGPAQILGIEPIVLPLPLEKLNHNIHFLLIDLGT